MSEPTHHLEFKERGQWRAWLEENHASASEAWLVVYKAKFKEAGLALGEAVEEALCFGWIDARLKPLDEQRYALRFSPRAANSVWSANNIRRVEKLRTEGKMTSAGEQKIAEAKARGEWLAALRRVEMPLIPADLEKALQETSGALAAFQALPDSRKKMYLYWLEEAKREETRWKRIGQIVEMALER